MSKQQGIDFPEIVERNTGKNKKRKGDFELWTRCYVLDNQQPPKFMTNWWKLRSYETIEIAEINLKNELRKRNRHQKNSTWTITWEFEIRKKKEST